MTKKLFALLITLTVVSTSSLFADWVVPASSLPQNQEHSYKEFILVLKYGKLKEMTVNMKLNYQMVLL